MNAVCHAIHDILCTHVLYKDVEIKIYNPLFDGYMSVTRRLVEREEDSAPRLYGNCVIITFVPKEHMAEEHGINENLFCTFHHILRD